jgi:hypothetical protein
MMRTPFIFIKKALSTTLIEINSTLIGKDHYSGQIEIQQLTTEEYLAVAGGPQIKNDPQE